MRRLAIIVGILLAISALSGCIGGNEDPTDNEAETSPDSQDDVDRSDSEDRSDDGDDGADINYSLSLSADPTEGKAPLNVTFSVDAQPQTNVSSWTLKSGPDASTEGAGSDLPADVDRTYESAGNVTAWFNVTFDDGTTRTEAVTVTVRSPPGPEPFHHEFSATGMFGVPYQSNPALSTSDFLLNSLDNGANGTYVLGWNFTLPDGYEELNVSTGATGPTGQDDWDLYLWSGPDRTLQGSSTTPASDEAVALANPPRRELQDRPAALGRGQQRGPGLHRRRLTARPAAGPTARIAPGLYRMTDEPRPTPQRHCGAHRTGPDGAAAGSGDLPESKDGEAGIRAGGCSPRAGPSRPERRRTPARRPRWARSRRGPRRGRRRRRPQRPSR